MVQPTATGMTLNAGAGGSDLAKTTHGGFEYQWAFACWWNESDSSPEVPTLLSAMPVQPGTGTTWVLGTSTAEIGKLAAGSEVIGAVTQSGTWNIGTLTTVTTVSTVTNLAKLGGQAIAMGTGVRTAGTQRVTIATDDVVPVTGTFWQATQPVSGTFWQATQPVSGTFWPGTQSVSGTVIVNAGTGFESLAVVGGGVEATALRVTLANDSTGTLTVDTTGTTGLEVVQSVAADLKMTEASASAIKTAVELLDDVVAVLGTATYAEATTKGNVAGAVRNNDLAALVDTDNEIAPLQVNSEGALYTTACASETKRASGVAVGGAPGTDDIVAAVAARKIRVLALGLFATSATPNNVFLDNVDNDLLFNTGNPLPLAIDADGDNVAGFVLPFNPGGWFETDTVNEAVTLNSSAAQDIAWTITYIEIP